MRKIRVHGKKGQYVYAKVDDDAYELVKQYKWYLSYKGYAQRNRKYKNHVPDKGNIFMHRLIMGARPGQTVDHSNRNKLDNRKSNLRFVSHGMNRVNAKLNKNNKSGHKNIYWYDKKKLWVIQIRRGGRQITKMRKSFSEALDVKQKLLKEGF